MQFSYWKAVFVLYMINTNDVAYLWHRKDNSFLNWEQRHQKRILCCWTKQHKWRCHLSTWLNWSHPYLTQSLKYLFSPIPLHLQDHNYYIYHHPQEHIKLLPSHLPSLLCWDCYYPVLVPDASTSTSPFPDSQVGPVMSSYMVSSWKHSHSYKLHHKHLETKFIMYIQ